jgi:capsular polysaccharide transport system permease protein
MRPRADGNIVQGDLGKGFAVQLRVIGALIIRDMMMRYGRANIGFLWVILEPMILTVGVMFMWSILKSPYEHGVQIVALVLTGYMPLTLFRHVTSIGPFLFRRSVPFLYHRHISFIDVLVARAILEFMGTTTALLVVYTVLALSNLVSPMRDPGLVALGWVTMALLSFGICCVFAVLTEYSEAAERFIQPFQYLMLPISGTFFMVDWLPKKAQEMIWYNPTVHCYEMFRAGVFGEEVLTYYDWWYPLVWALALTAFGLAMIDAVRDKIHTG